MEPLDKHGTELLDQQDFALRPVDGFVVEAIHVFKVGICDRGGSVRGDRFCKE